ncbi:MAG: FG-GAP-like repeat-containing protein [Planctomycetota bacterium]
MKRKRLRVERLEDRHLLSAIELVEVGRISRDDFTRPTEGSAFGSSIAEVGDIDGNGVNDLAVGAPGDGDQESPGWVTVLFMNDDRRVERTHIINNRLNGFTDSLTDQSRFGSSVAPAGDLNGDGVPDLLVGADGQGGRGAVWLVMLNRTGRVIQHSRIDLGAAPLVGQLASGSRFGASIVSLGDLDGDGISELAVGAPGDPKNGKDAGAVWVLYLDQQHSVRNAVRLEGDASERFGASLAATDLDENGNPNLLVGRPGHQDGRGGLWVLELGNSAEVIASSTIPAPNNATGFGEAISVVNTGDGTHQIAVGAPQTSSVGPTTSGCAVAPATN